MSGEPFNLSVTLSGGMIEVSAVQQASKKENTRASVGKMHPNAMGRRRLALLFVVSPTSK